MSPAPFHTVYADELKISPSRIQGLTETYRDRKRTGLIRLAYSQDLRIYLLFNKGIIVNNFQILPSSTQILDDPLSVVADCGEAYARLIPLSPVGLQICKLAIGSKVGSLETMDAVHLRASLSSGWNHQPDPRLIQLSWNTAEGLIFFSGDAQEDHSIFFSPDRLIDQAGLASTFSMWADPVCKVDSHFLDPASTIWQEFILRRTFSGICVRSFLRVEKITGRAMVDTVIRSMNLQAASQNLGIGIAVDRVMDQEIFPSPQKAAEVYQDLIGMMLNNVRKVVGARLADSLVREVVTELRPEEQEMVQAFNILPEGS